MIVSEVLAKDLNREIKVDVPRDNIEDKLLSKLEELKNTVQLKGFRPGKVPIHHLRKIFGQRLMPEIIEDLVKETSAKAMSDRNERPAIQPKISFYQGKPSEDKEKEEIDKIIKLEKDLSYKMDQLILMDQVIYHNYHIDHHLLYHTRNVDMYQIHIYQLKMNSFQNNIIVL